MKTLRLLGPVVALMSALMMTGCKKDPCKDVKCQNGGACQDGNCRCTLPWEGSRCELDARDKFVGSWRGTATCRGNTSSLTTSIIKSASVANRIILDDIYGELNSSTSFTIPTQSIDMDGIAGSVNGNGSISGNQLTMTLIISVGGESITCQYILNRQ